MRQAVKAVGNRMGIPESFLDSKYILEAIDEAATALRQTDPRIAEDFYRSAHQAIIDIELAAARESHLIPGVVPLFRDLKRHGILTGVVTRNCRQAVETIAGSDMPVDSMRTRDEVEKVKPDPEHLTVALRDLGASPGESLMVGDHPMDIVAGKAVGMRTVGVLTGNCPVERLQEAGADYVLPSVETLYNLLGSEHLLPTP